jgi:polysaccharide biosynthesis/export protein
MSFDPTPVGGVTVREMELKITKRLSDGYLCHSSVSARLSKLRQIYVVDDVKPPGSYP